MNTNELQHWGIKGMHWGIRRYQNPDGSLTAEGKKRYSKGKEYSDDYWNAHDKKDPKYMSDKELQQRINRLNNENQYNNLTKSEAQKMIEEAGKKFIKTAVIGGILAFGIKKYKEYGSDIIEIGKDHINDMLAFAEEASKLKEYKWQL